MIPDATRPLRRPPAVVKGDDGAHDATRPPRRPPVVAKGEGDNTPDATRPLRCPPVPPVVANRETTTLLTRRVLSDAPSSVCVCVCVRARTLMNSVSMRSAYSQLVESSFSPYDVEKTFGASASEVLPSV